MKGKEYISLNDKNLSGLNNDNDKTRVSLL